MSKKILSKYIGLGIFFLLVVETGYSQQLQVSFSENLSRNSFTGNVYIFLSKNDKEPINAPNWIIMNPVVTAKVRDLLPGRNFTITAANTDAYPVALTDMERGEYYTQIIFDNNMGGRAIAGTVGNYYSASQKITYTHDLKRKYHFVADKIIEEVKFINTIYTKKIELASSLLTSFFKKTVNITAAIRLPKEYIEQPEKKFPLKVQVRGFGSDIKNLSGSSVPAAKGMDSIPFVIVTLDGNCPTGHSVYANSDNNGPWGDALVYELIPYLEKEYRLNGFRFVTGHSSGGWSSLWLQSHYPEVFHGCWSSSPDAIDFRNFEGVNLYTDTNVFYDSSGKLLPGMTVGGSSLVNYKKDVCGWERIIRGEQYMSFNAVFGGRKNDGSIDYLWNFSDGSINISQREHWRPYDISNYLTLNWEKLHNNLAGKILITVGKADNWSLEKAVDLFKKDIIANKMEIAVTILPGDHFTVFTNERDSIGTRHTIGCYDTWKLKH